MTNFILKNTPFVDRILAATFSISTFILLDYLLPEVKFSELIVLTAILQLTMPLSTWGAQSTLLGKLSAMEESEKAYCFFSCLAAISIMSVCVFFINLIVTTTVIGISPLSYTFFAVGIINSWVVCDLYFYNQGLASRVLFIRLVIFLVFLLVRVILANNGKLDLLIISLPLEASVRYFFLFIQLRDKMWVKIQDITIFLRQNFFTTISNLFNGGIARSVIPLSSFFAFADIRSLGYAQRCFEFGFLLLSAFTQSLCVRLSRIKEDSRFKIFVNAILRRFVIFLVLIYCLYAIGFGGMIMTLLGSKLDGSLLIAGFIYGAFSGIFGLIAFLSSKFEVERERATIGLLSAPICYVLVLILTYTHDLDLLFLLLPLCSMLALVLFCLLLSRFIRFRRAMVDILEQSSVGAD